MTQRKLYTLEILTKSGAYYVFPQVDLRGVILDPHLSQNPCLQLINADHAVLSLVWDQITKITRYIFRTAEQVVAELKVGPEGFYLPESPVTVWEADGHR